MIEFAIRSGRDEVEPGLRGQGYLDLTEEAVGRFSDVSCQDLRGLNEEMKSVGPLKWLSSRLHVRFGALIGARPLSGALS